MTDRILHFTLGPVQGFVSQARRTRDLWAGSFLLSWLSGKAMRAIVDGRHGRIEFPDVAGDDMFLALGGKDGVPVIGSLPNRFKAIISDEQCNPGNMCRMAVGDAWRSLSDAVWDTFIAKVASQGTDTKAIWDQQIEHFWEMSWVTGAPPDTGNPDARDDGAWLDRRKNWRSHLRPEEGGDHCMLMGDWQEISGFVRFHTDGRKAQDDFWNAIRQCVLDEVYPHLKGKNDANILELRKTERLCAIALVKRLFPLLRDEKLKQTIGWVPDGTRDKLRKWPSTAYMAAAPWMKRAWDENPNACGDYVKAVKTDHDDDVLVQRAEHVSRISNFQGMNEFADLDGRLFYSDAVRNDKAITQSSRTMVLKALDTFQGAIPAGSTKRKNKMREASPFYALLRMDGDRVGDLLQNLGGEAVSQALAGFTGIIPDIVMHHDGVTIYAGGDDYLGFFPLCTALDAAAELADAYRNVWSDNSGTTSAGLVFAHYHVALSSVINKSHHLLDEVAKKNNGRDSIAVGVMKPSGGAAEWVSCWSEAGEPASAGYALHLKGLAQAFADDDERSTSFVYNIRERYDRSIKYDGDKDCAPSLWQTLDATQTQAVLLAERLKGIGKQTRAQRQMVEEEIDQVMKVCRPLTRAKGNIKETDFSTDGSLLARFLADNGIWIGGDD